MNKTIEVIKDIRTLCTHIFEGGHPLRLARPPARSLLLLPPPQPQADPEPNPAPQSPPILQPPTPFRPNGPAARRL